MDAAAVRACTAFAGSRRLAVGPVRDVARAVKLHLGAHPEAQVLVFDNATAYPLEFDLRGTVDDVAARFDGAAEASADAVEPCTRPRGPGRPKLGVTAREVTLLPRHWDWLAAQPGGASVTLRKLVEAASRAAEGPDRRRAAQEAAYRFMSAVAGDAASFEEAARALFAADAGRFATLTQPWPADVRDFARELARAAFETAPAPAGAPSPSHEVVA
ncbi:DUF2239 family protein [Ralstonia syzygii subsp. celebesensis]|uniref:DUF2239 domain-containing protein n=3 Tax=Ralstonia solanacearum species complex TaxID=3116862 RepID=A0AAD0SCT6_RALSL|nr:MULTISPECIES: DUF2239 family protein [Ralstonia solanacearum species complex]CCA81811.1 conserved hypothethical protein [blood disease bacterium R229]AQW31106.1 hypothetical protein B0B51_14920 [blood disease bacterium A2-HR MARDI]AXV84263.1 DUF2239 domain-containing protein [Ralstonia solanacearum]AXW55395.1 DUF2239 domain-containing protein [Ralstonia solanacearum]QQV55100.1 DUF2239 family protein [Ralstonia syzygii subsp. celebesensis]